MTLVILCVAAFAAVAYGVSIVSFVALRAFGRQISLLTPVAQARLYLCGALLPLAVAGALLIAALAPSFGWIADHCAVTCDPHLHPHICTDHHTPAWPAVSLVMIAIIMLTRLTFVLARRVYALSLGRRTERALDRVANTTELPGVRVLPLQDAQAFVLGLFRPRLYVTQGILSGSERSHFAAVVAHENAHLNRRDPLRRFVASIGLGVHLPWIASWIDRRLACAQEMAADELAAESVGSRDSIAEALVALARSQVATPATAVAFAGSDVQRRVAELLDPRSRANQPSRLTLALTGTLMVLAIAVSADTIHHGVETLLGVIGI